MNKQDSVPNLNELNDDLADDESQEGSSGLKLRTGLKAGLNFSNALAAPVASSNLNLAVNVAPTAMINPIETVIMGNPTKNHGLKLRVRL
jgi:hypothetical protein